MTTTKRRPRRSPRTWLVLAAAAVGGAVRALVEHILDLF